MKFPPFVELAIRPTHAKVTEERIKARAGYFQNLSLAIFGLSVLAPTFSQPSKIKVAVLIGGALLAGLLFVVSQAILGYLPNPNPPAPPKEDMQDG